MFRVLHKSCSRNIKKRYLSQQLKFLDPNIVLHVATVEVDINFEITIEQLNENVELNILHSE